MKIPSNQSKIYNPESKPQITAMPPNLRSRKTKKNSKITKTKFFIAMTTPNSSYRKNCLLLGKKREIESWLLSRIWSLSNREIVNGLRTSGDRNINGIPIPPNRGYMFVKMEEGLLWLLWQKKCLYFQENLGIILC